MTSERDLKLVYSVAVILFIVGLFCYAAFPVKPPDEPLRIQYRSATGNVLFEHAKHATEYDVSCYDCHHHPGDDEAGLIACSECHLKNPEENAPPPERCLDCHDADDIEDTEMPSQPDASHDQCSDCHSGIGAGPVKQACSECHAQ
jgi:hypothetical protein